MYEKTLPHVSPVWNRYTSLVIDHARGAHVYDITGREYLDFTSGIGVTSTGHCHPEVVAAIQQQATQLLHAQFNIYYQQDHPPQALSAFSGGGVRGALSIFVLLRNGRRCDHRLLSARAEETVQGTNCTA